ncbi:e3 ubiquitin-protein ligase amfr [Anaeramoeba flamelloides]|uniref:RING-type E3 ubiquitin transferase n=1 Tax=Anaeramoeba flamelloides TaxID=1746091 RepID=A0AAV7Y812_9EUKA|nr:e3 ubiquitin-protein ligase amfr [Anaeramoeba flamelloides]
MLLTIENKIPRELFTLLFVTVNILLYFGRVLLEKVFQRLTVLEMKLIPTQIIQNYLFSHFFYFSLYKFKIQSLLYYNYILIFIIYFKIFLIFISERLSKTISNTNANYNQSLTKIRVVNLIFSVLYNCTIVVQLVYFFRQKQANLKYDRRQTLFTLFLESILFNGTILGNYLKLRVYQRQESLQISRSHAKKTILEQDLILKATILFILLFHYFHLIHLLNSFSFSHLLLILRLKIFFTHIQTKLDIYQEFKQTTSSILQQLKPISDEEYHLITKDETKCTICRSELQSQGNIKKLECNHCFHQNCLEEWLFNKNICPLCSKKMKLKKNVVQLENSNFEKFTNALRIVINICNFGFLSKIFKKKNNPLRIQEEQRMITNIQQLLNRRDISQTEIRRELSITRDPNIAVQRLLQRYSNN